MPGSSLKPVVSRSGRGAYDVEKKTTYREFMDIKRRTSRQRYVEYQQRFQDQQAGIKTDGEQLASAEFSRRRKGIGRGRSAWTLIAEFWVLVREHRRTIAVSLALLSVATVLGLVPPAATKILIDNVLGSEPIPDALKTVAGSDLSPKGLLVWICVTVFIVSMVKLLIGLASRWMATRTTKLVQMSVRKKVWEHSVRLPMSAVHELRSGSVASLLREDAGSVGELVPNQNPRPLFVCESPPPCFVR